MSRTNMEYLEKHKQATGNDDKYYINCNHFSNDASSIHPQELIKNDTNVAVLRAIATDETIRTKNRHIVVKISRIDGISDKEYNIGKSVYHLPGFIKFLCLFQCYDDTIKQNRIMKEGEAPRPFSTPICNADIDAKNYTQVLVMPYIRQGSILRHNWTNENTNLLKSLIIHTIFSLANAFEKVGFLHGDLHWDNILFKKTTAENITYDLKSQSITVPTNGYKVVIMDFEKSGIRHNDVSYFWDNLTFLCKFSGIQNKNNERMKWNNAIILLLLEDMSSRHAAIDNVATIITKIYESSICFVTIQPPMKYNPDIF